MHDWKNHPGREKLFKRIKKLYVKDERSTSQIAKIVRMSELNINHILKKQGIQLRPQSVIDNRYYQTSSHLTPTQLLKEIKDRYVYKKHSGNRIADDLGIDPGTVTTKLRALGIPIRHPSQKFKKGGYPCQWCGKIMGMVYQNSGKKKQLYCDSSCKNKAKDFRRMLKGARVSETRLKAMDDFLREVWGIEYESARRKILDVKPVITCKK